MESSQILYLYIETCTPNTHNCLSSWKWVGYLISLEQIEVPTMIALEQIEVPVVILQGMKIVV